MMDGSGSGEFEDVVIDEDSEWRVITEWHFVLHGRFGVLFDLLFELQFYPFLQLRKLGLFRRYSISTHWQVERDQKRIGTCGTRSILLTEAPICEQNSGLIFLIQDKISTNSSKIAACPA